MAFARTASIALVGVEGHVVDVEAHLAQGLPGFIITGLPDASVAEARDRVRAAVLNSGQSWPPRRMTVGLGPAWLPKHGTGHDLAVALAILAAAEVVPASSIHEVVFIGELGLDGSVRPVRGVLPAVVAAARAGRSRVVVAAENAAEARLVPGLRVLGVRSLAAAIALLRGEDSYADEVPPAIPSDDVPIPDVDAPDMVDVVGQEVGRLAVEVAAAGGHHVALFGPPGTGKTAPEIPHL